MKYNRFVTKIKNSKLYYGWIITAIAFFCIMFSGPGQTYFFSTFIDSYIEEFGWSRSAISSLYSTATLISGLLLFIIGRCIDKYGQKKMILLVAFLLVLSCIWNSFISSIWMLFIGFFSGRFLGQGSLCLIPSVTIPKWFVKKRALAFSIMTVGGVAGSAIVPPLNTILINNYGWNNTWRLWAVILLVFFIPLVYFFFFDKPQDLGLQAYDSKENDVNNTSITEDDTDFSWTLKEAIRTKSFWLMLICQITIPTIHTGLVFHFISIMGTKGLAPSTSAYVLSIIALVAFPSTFLAGYILEHIRIKLGAAIMSTLLLIGLIVLLNSTSLLTIIIFAVIHGIALGFSPIFSGLIWPHYFGIKHLGSIRGAITTFSVMGAAVGPLPFGFTYDAFGRYTESFYLMMIIASVSIIAALLSKTPIKKA